MRRALATALTLGLLSGFVFAVVLGLLVAFGALDLTIAVALVVLFNAVMLLVGPTLNDLLYRYLYDMDWVSFEEFRERSAASAAVAEDVTTEFDYSKPKLGIIPDSNPTAFTYGSGRFNVRVVVTEGCFEYLDDDELASVVAHELGHVTSRDFIVMTLANTLVEILYLVAVHGWRIAAATSAGSGSGAGSGGGGKRADPTVVLYGVAVVAYVMWFFGEYIVLYLSRVREYAADRFAADRAHPDLLSSSLVKIAYGIVTSEDSPELAKATRNIGFMNVADSTDEGLIYASVRDEPDDEELLLRSFLFDLKNPWARLLELNSTHPLTGKRVRELSTRPGATRFDFDAVVREFPVDARRMYREFARDLAVSALPLAGLLGFPLVAGGALVATDLAFSVFWFAGGWLAAFGLALLALAYYEYPRGDAELTTVVSVLADPYASPVCGRRVEFDGELVGRGVAGYAFSEDMLFQDRTGLMLLEYESWLTWLGNFLFSIRRVPELVGQRATVDCWYFRGVSTWTGLRRLQTGDDEVTGFVHLGGVIGGGILVALGVLVALAGAVV